jgi:hypothetical protein
LAHVLEVLSKDNVNIEYMYGFVEKAHDKALLVFRFEDPDKAIDALSKHKIKIVKKDQIVKL